MWGTLHCKDPLDIKLEMPNRHSYMLEVHRDLDWREKFLSYLYMDDKADDIIKEVHKYVNSIKV